MPQVPVVATNHSQAQGLAPIVPPLTIKGQQAASIINATNAAAHRTYRALFGIIEDSRSDRAEDGGPLPVVNPLVTLATQTGSIGVSNTGALVRGSDLTITNDAMTSEQRYMALQDAAATELTKESLAALGSLIDSAAVQAAVEAAHASKAA